MLSYECKNGINRCSPTEITRSDLDKAVELFFEEPFHDNFDFFDANERHSIFLFIPKCLVRNISSIDIFIPVISYPDINLSFKSEIGCVGNIRILVTKDYETVDASSLGYDPYLILRMVYIQGQDIQQKLRSKDYDKELKFFTSIP